VKTGKTSNFNKHIIAFENGGVFNSIQNNAIVTLNLHYYVIIDNMHRESHKRR